MKYIKNTPSILNLVNTALINNTELLSVKIWEDAIDIMDESPSSALLENGLTLPDLLHSQPFLQAAKHIKKNQDIWVIEIVFDKTWTPLYHIDKEDCYFCIEGLNKLGIPIEKMEDYGEVHPIDLTTEYEIID